MVKESKFVVLSLVSFAALAGCGGAQAAAESPAEAEPASPAPASPSPAAASPSEPPSGLVARPELTAEECEAGGGMVVGDIGDGAIHRPDYRCASGAEPSGTIKAPEGGPMGVEGSVCCPK